MFLTVGIQILKTFDLRNHLVKGLNSNQASLLFKWFKHVLLMNGLYNEWWSANWTNNFLCYGLKCPDFEWSAYSCDQNI